MTLRLGAAVLLLWAAPARASLGAFEPSVGEPRAEFRLSGRHVAREGGMTICTDGVIRDPERARVIRARDRNHQEQTALTTGRRRPLDPDVVPYFVLPRGFGGARLGDLALVSYRGRSVWAVAGDRGPCEGCQIGRRGHRRRYAFGEGSVALARALGVPGAEDGDGGGAADGVTYLVFPGSGPGRPFESQESLLAHIERGASDILERYFSAPRPLRLAAAAP